MHYTKIALLTFGAGLLLGLIVVVVEVNPIARIASGLMVLGIALIPVGIAVDWRMAAKSAPPPARKRVKPPVRHRTAAAPRRPPRQRKRAAPKR